MDTSAASCGEATLKGFVVPFRWCVDNVVRHSVAAFFQQTERHCVAEAFLEHSEFAASLVIFKGTSGVRSDNSHSVQLG